MWKLLKPHPLPHLGKITQPPVWKHRKPDNEGNLSFARSSYPFLLVLDLETQAQHQCWYMEALGCISLGIANPYCTPSCLLSPIQDVAVGGLAVHGRSRYQWATQSSHQLRLHGLDAVPPMFEEDVVDSGR